MSSEYESAMIIISPFICGPDTRASQTHTRTHTRYKALCVCYNLVSTARPAYFVIEISTADEIIAAILLSE